MRGGRSARGETSCPAASPGCSPHARTRLRRLSHRGTSDPSRARCGRSRRPSCEPYLTSLGLELDVCDADFGERLAAAGVAAGASAAGEKGVACLSAHAASPTLDPLPCTLSARVLPLHLSYRPSRATHCQGH